MGARVLVLGVVAVALGCVQPSAVITSARNPSLPGNLQELFVLSEVGEFGEASADAFEKQFTETAESCGIRVGFSRVSRTDLAQTIHQKRIIAFGADHVMTLATTARTNGRGRVVSVSYDARVFADSSQALLWRAEIRLKVGARLASDAGPVLADQLLSKLNDDGVTTWCHGAYLKSADFKRTHARAP